MDGFAGRAAQLAQLDAFLAAQASTLVIAAIEGAAGVGKTSLALHWAHRVRDRFPDGQLYVNLCGYAATPPMQPSQALAQFLRALGVADERLPADLGEAAAMYRTLLADRRMLILLDNAARPEQVRPLLPGNPHCLVLVTSRDRLGGLVASDGARLLDLDVLDADEAHTLLTNILGRSRVDSQPQAAAELARLCGFLPLALRIAAANLLGRAGVGIGQYVAELREGNRLAALQIDGDESLAVRAAFDLSYAALKPAERGMFRLLGLVPGPDVELAGAACLAGVDPPQARRVLRRLVDAHLVTEPAADRFSLHDLLRQYARSLADSEDGPAGCAAAIRRLGESFLAATRAAADLLYLDTLRLPVPADCAAQPAAQFADHTAALAWLDAERANLVAMVNWAAEHGPQSVVWQLADNLRGYFYLRRHLVDHLAVATDAIRAAQGLPGPQAAGHLNLGAAHDAHGHTETAIEHYTTALALAEQAGWAEGQGAALNNLGTVHSQTGRHRQAAQRFGQAAAVFARTGRLIGQAICLDNLGIVRRELGELPLAASLHEQAIALHRKTGYPIGHATALGNLAAVYHDLGRLDEAERHYLEALALHRQTGNRFREAVCRCGLAELYCATGRHRDAEAAAEQGFNLAHEIGDPRTEASAAMTLAAIDGCAGRHQSALDRYHHALDLAQQSDGRYLRARALVGIAASQLRLGRADQALRTVEAALIQIRDGGYRKLEVDALSTLVSLYTAQGRPEQAAALDREVVTLRRLTGYVPS